MVVTILNSKSRSGNTSSSNNTWLEILATMHLAHYGFTLWIWLTYCMPLGQLECTHAQLGLLAFQMDNHVAAAGLGKHTALAKVQPSLVTFGYCARGRLMAIFALCELLCALEGKLCSGASCLRMQPPLQLPN